MKKKKPKKQDRPLEYRRSSSMLFVNRINKIVDDDERPRTVVPPVLVDLYLGYAAAIASVYGVWLRRTRRESAD